MTRTLAIFVLLLVCLGRASAATANADRPKWKTGDAWTYTLPDGSTVTWKVTAVSAQGYTLRRESSDKTQTIGVSRDLTLETLWPHWPVTVGNPYLSIQWPLQVGKNWTRTDSGLAHEPDTPPTGRSTPGTWETTWTVMRQQTLTVPAGTFETYLLSGRQCFTPASRKTVCAAVQVSYAPQAKNIIRIAWENTGYFDHTVRGRDQTLASYSLSRR